MKNVKESIKKAEDFGHQALLDMWSKDQFKMVRKKFFKLYIKTRKTTRDFLKKDFKKQTKNVQDLFFVQKAIFYGASQKLPYLTLKLLGEKLSHPAYKEDMVKIIEDNLIKCKESFYKLDDQENQAKIQKALRTYQFEECAEIRNQVA